ncbi:cell division protease FtsH [Thermocatellispora tengchongensis]|uniref:ATP-dependent zinc metalloprotease FtsH n=1 Tax=Thermocatellispora tengchongensis TaxID=1073253 RepID=A0A840P613_9ACTN|nr:ATP-dependent zinc metalloprotease FtsH [Thermocatellispora tengchongensis]MBB5135108.1 cell division protease FtsH [Thermocatellispora tengchongensis]
MNAGPHGPAGPPSDGTAATGGFVHASVRKPAPPGVSDTDRGAREAGRNGEARNGRRDAARRENGDDRPKPWRIEGLGDRGGKSQRPKINWWRFAMTLVAAYALFFFVSSFFDAEQPETIAYTQFTEQVRNGNVKDIYAQGDSIQGNLKQPAKDSDNVTYTRFVTERPTFADDDIYQQMASRGVVVRAEPIATQRGFLVNLLLSLLPVALLAGLYIWFIRRSAGMLGGGGLGGLGRSRAAKPVETGEVRVTFDDVAGIDEVENELVEVVDYLKEPEKYRRLGAKLPKGVLLAGPPGTGKTLLARAVAGEANVPFFSASASEFIEMIVGVGASRVRDLFMEARKVAPSIIFIDEIDAIGRTRGGMAVGGHDEREQTLNQILTEMDGFTGSEGVIVIAATNRPEILDPALLRPGRFDRTVMVAPPDATGRVAILKVHTRGVPLAPDVDLGRLAKSSPGMTGADLANLVNEAALLAAKRGRTAVAPADFADALEKLQLGTARAIVMPEEERRRTAYHEAGHALLGMLQEGADPVRKISIIPRGRALGVTLSTPDSDRYNYDERYLRGRIIGALGGMAAEQVVYGVITTGSESDLEQVTSIARGMVGRWGMSPKIGPLTILPASPDGGQPAAAPATLAAVDQEARRIVDECYEVAIRVLTENRDRLDAIVTALLENETLDETQAYTAAGLPHPHRPTQPPPLPPVHG